MLFRIDPVPFELRVERAQATVRGLEAKLAVTADQVAAQTTNADNATRGIAAAQAQLTLASSTLNRPDPAVARLRATDAGIALALGFLAEAVRQRKRSGQSGSDQR
ncbi:MAG: hypothetical protein JOY71_08775 [Acetobacteraceae bacterium]|nr:hypothetical protein [Acetobacteraceae bacterium]